MTFVHDPLNLGGSFPLTSGKTMPTENHSVVLDVFLLTLTIPNEQPEADIAAIRESLDQQSFSTRLQALVNEWLQTFPTLAAVTVTVSR